MSKKNWFFLATVVAIIGLVGCHHAEVQEPAAALAPTSTEGGSQPQVQVVPPQVDTWDSGEVSLRSDGTLAIKAVCGKAGKPNTAHPAMVGDFNYWGQGGIVEAVTYDAATDTATINLKLLGLSEGTNRLNVFVFNAQGATEGKYLSFAHFNAKTREFFFRVSNNNEGHPVIAVVKNGDRYEPAAVNIKVDVRM